MAPMSAAHRLVLVLVAVIAVVGIAVLGLSVAGTGNGLGPDGSASADPSHSIEPSATASAESSAEPSVPSEAEIQAILDEIEEQVIGIRGLDAADIGPADIITRDELAVELQQLFDEQYPPEEQERDTIALRALGLLEPDQDVAELQLQLLGDSVLGFYDDIGKRMVVVSDAGLDVEARITYAHEYTHALQDAAFGPGALDTDTPGDDDGDLARLSMIEGDATLTMLAWMLQNLTQQ